MTPSKAESDLLANPGVRPTTYVLGQAYGVTILKPAGYAIGRSYGVTIFGAEDLPNAVMTPDEMRAQDPGRFLPPALAPLADDLRRRGLLVEHHCWSALSIDQYLEATLNDHPFAIIVRISTMHKEPLALQIAGGHPSDFVRSHSTTHERLLHTVDVFLAGIRAASR